jgi:hypothetical protein
MEPEPTPAECLRRLISGPLLFGDAAQIEAIAVLRLAEAVLDQKHEVTCPDCEGKGEIGSGFGHCDDCGRRCDYCSPRDCARCDGDGFLTLYRDEVYDMPANRLRRLILRPAKAHNNREPPAQTRASLSDSPEATA